MKNQVYSNVDLLKKMLTGFLVVTLLVSCEKPKKEVEVGKEVVCSNVSLKGQRELLNKDLEVLKSKWKYLKYYADKGCYGIAFDYESDYVKKPRSNGRIEIWVDPKVKKKWLTLNVEPIRINKLSLVIDFGSKYESLSGSDFKLHKSIKELIEDQYGKESLVQTLDESKWGGFGGGWITMRDYPNFVYWVSESGREMLECFGKHRNDFKSLPMACRLRFSVGSDVVVTTLNLDADNLINFVSNINEIKFIVRTILID